MFGKKCKLFVSTLLTAAICISFSSVGSMALSKPQNHKAPQTQSMTEFENNIAQKFIKDNAGQKKTQRQKSTKIKLMAPEAPLTDAYIYAIVSETSKAEHPDVNGIEYVNHGQVGRTTQFHHGGEAVVVIVEMGFSNPSLQKAVYKGTNYDWYNESGLGQTGQPAYGMMYFYDIPKVDGGSFDYQSTSNVMPYNYFHDWITIN